jgi:hypothetical protein
MNIRYVICDANIGYSDEHFFNFEGGYNPHLSFVYLKDAIIRKREMQFEKIKDYMKRKSLSPLSSYLDECIGFGETHEKKMWQIINDRLFGKEFNVNNDEHINIAIDVLQTTTNSKIINFFCICEVEIK